MPTNTSDSFSNIVDQMYRFDQHKNVPDPINPYDYAVTPADDIYDYAGSKLGLISRYPRYSADPTFDIEHYYGQRQTGWDKLSNAVGQFKDLFGNTFVNHFQSYGRDLNALKNLDVDKLWNDAYGEQSAELVRAVQNLHPIYETKEQRARKQRGGAWSALQAYRPFSVGAGNAWANLLGQAGFTAGTIGAVLTENVALGLATGGLGNIAKAPSSTKALVKSFWRLAKTTDFLKDAKYTGKGIRSAQSLSQAMKIAAQNPKLRGSFVGYRMYTAAHGEAAIEANMAALEFREQQIDQFVRENGYRPPAEVVQQIEEQAVRVGNATFNWNLPVLMGGNYAVFGNLFTKRTLSSALPREIKLAVNERFKTLTKELLPEKNIGKTFKVLDKAKPYLDKTKKLRTYAGGAVGEGLEELLQGVGARSAQHTFDMYNSDAGGTTLAFLQGAMGEELWHTLNTREGWDEFFAGFFTGGGIKALNHAFEYAYDKRTGRKEKIKTAVEEAAGVKDEKGKFLPGKFEEAIRRINPLLNISESGNNTSELLKNFYNAFGSRQASEENDNHQANNFKAEAEAEFFSSMLMYDKLDEVLDLYEDTLKAIEADENGQDVIEKMLDGASIGETVNELREKGKAWEKDYNMLRRVIGDNPIEAESGRRHVWEHAFKQAVSMKSYARERMIRLEKLSRQLKNSGVNETIVDALADPDIRAESIETIRDLVATQKENIQLKKDQGDKLTDKEKEQLKQDEALLKTLENIESVKNPKDLLKSIFHDIDFKALPVEVRQLLADLYKTEREGAYFAHLFNLLQNKDYFDKYADSFMLNYMKLNMDFIKPREPVDLAEADEVVPITDIGGITEAELEDALAEAEGPQTGIAVGEALATLKSAEENITETEDGFVYAGETYPTKSEIYDKILDELPAGLKRALRRKAKDGESLKTKVKRRHVGWVNEQREEKEQADEDALSGEPTPREEEPANPKTRADAEEEAQRHVKSSTPGQSKLHNFVKALSFVWRATNQAGRATYDTLKKYFQTLDTEKARGTLRVLDYQRAKYKDPVVVTIHGYTLEEFNTTWNPNDTDKIDIWTEETKYNRKGDRIYLVFENPTDQTITEFLRDELNGLIVNHNDGFHKLQQISKDGKLVSLDSNFEILAPVDELYQAVSELSPNQNLGIRIPNTEYNQGLIQQYNDEKLSKDRLLTLLEFHFYTVSNSKEVAIGKFRSAYALFQEDNIENAEFRKKFENFIGNKIDLTELSKQKLGVTKYIRTETFSNIAYEADGATMIWTDLKEYEQFLPPGYQVEYYYAEDSTTLRPLSNPNRAERLDRLNRNKFRKGAVYMKVYEDKKDANGDVTSQIVHTSQVYHVNDDFFSFDEFKNGEFLKGGVTNLHKGELPFVSKRVIISLEDYDANGQWPMGEERETYNDHIEDLQEKFYNIPGRTITDADGNEIVVRDVNVSYLLGHRKEPKDIVLANATLDEGTNTIRGYAMDNLGRISKEETTIPLTDITGFTELDLKSKHYTDLTDQEKAEIETDVKDLMAGRNPTNIKIPSDFLKQATKEAEKRYEEFKKKPGNQGKPEHILRKEFIKELWTQYQKKVHPNNAKNQAPVAVQNIATIIFKTFENAYNPSSALYVAVMNYFDIMVEYYKPDIKELKDFKFKEPSGSFWALKTQADRRAWIYYRGKEHETHAIEPAKNNPYTERYHILSITSEDGVKVVKVKRYIGVEEEGGVSYSTIEFYYADEDGNVHVKDRVTDVEEKVKNVAKLSKQEALQIAFRINNGIPLTFQQYRSLRLNQRNVNLVRKYLRRMREGLKYISDDPIIEIKQLLDVMGLPAETVFSAMIKEYQRALLVGKPYSSLDELLTALPLDDSMRSIFDDAVSNAFLGFAVWEYITQSDAVFEYKGNENLLTNLGNIQDELNQLQATVDNIREDNKTPERARNFRQQVVDELIRITEKVNLSVLDPEKLVHDTLDRFKTFVNGVLDVLKNTNPLDFVREAINFNARMGLAGASLILDRLIKTQQVSRFSRGKNPIYATQKEGILLDIAMYREGEGRNPIVRNEADGLFLQMRRVRGEAPTQDVLDIKQKMLNLLGVNVSQEYLQAYKRLNKNFDKLEQRLNDEILRQKQNVANAWGYASHGDDAVIKGNAVDRDTLVVTDKKGLLVVKTNDMYIRVSGELYRNVMDMNRNKAVYVKDNRKLTTFEVSEILRKAGVKADNVFRRDQAVRRRIGNLQKIKDEIDRMSCNL